MAVRVFKMGQFPANWERYIATTEVELKATTPAVEFAEGKAIDTKRSWEWFGGSWQLAAGVLGLDASGNLVASGPVIDTGRQQQGSLVSTDQIPATRNGSPITLPGSAFGGGGGATIYADTGTMDAVTGAAGAMCTVLDDGYGKPADFWWNPSQRDSGAPAAIVPRWVRKDKTHLCYSLRQAAGNSVSNSVTKTRLDVASTSAYGEGYFGMRKRTLRHKHLVRRLHLNFVWKLADQTNKITLFVGNPDDSITWGSVVLNSRQNMTTLGYVAGNDCMGELHWEMYLVSSQNANTANPITCYTRTRATLHAKLSTTTQQIVLEDVESEQPMFAFDPTIDQPLALWAQHSVAAASNSVGINWMNLGECPF